MPATAEEFGARDRPQPIPKPSRRCKGRGSGTFWINWWGKYVKDDNERLRFVLFPYNAGLSHIDARNPAKKYGKNPARWEDVESFLCQKSNPRYYQDAVVLAGYCKCEEPVNYVHDILHATNNTNSYR